MSLAVLTNKKNIHHTDFAQPLTKIKPVIVKEPENKEKQQFSAKVLFKSCLA